MAFRPPHSREKLPRCTGCGARHPHVVTRENGVTVWLCTACEYRERFPAASLIPAAPNARPARPLQTEVLFP